MNDHQLLAAINGAVIHLAWLDDGRYRQALALLAKTPIRADEDRAGGGGSDAGRRSVGGHSDPTGDAVVGAADCQAQLSDRAEIICDTARWLRSATAGVDLPAAPGTLAAALADLTWCVTVPHLITTRQPTNAEERRELHAAVDLVWCQAGALQSDVERALRYSATVAAGRPAQKPIVECRACGSWRSGTIAGAKGICDQCTDFRRAHKCLPTEAIVRRWDIGKGATPGMILEAKVTTRKPKRSRAS